MEYSFSEYFTEEDYKQILIKGYDYNQLGLDIIAFVLNIFLLFSKVFLAKMSLTLLVITFMLSMMGHDVSLGKYYALGNKLFNISTLLNYSVYALTIVALIVS